MIKQFNMEPPPHTGVHQWLPRQVRLASFCGFTRDYILKTFPPVFNQMKCRGALHREVTERDLEQALDLVFGPRGNHSTPPTAGPMVFDPSRGWPTNVTIPRIALNKALINIALRDSPVKSVSDIPTHRGAVSSLFREGDTLCVGHTPARYRHCGVDELDTIAYEVQFIVPNPLRKCVGTTLSGRQTSHCRDATGDRRFIVMENDTGATFDDQVAVLFWLAADTEVPLRAVVRSGGKSIHGWFDVEGASPQNLFDWFTKCAAPLGADPRLFVPEQFVRMPGGLRDNGNRQEILYLK